MQSGYHHHNLQTRNRSVPPYISRHISYVINLQYYTTVITYNFKSHCHNILYGRAGAGAEIMNEVGASAGAENKHCLKDLLSDKNSIIFSVFGFLIWLSYGQELFYRYCIWLQCAISWALIGYYLEPLVVLAVMATIWNLLCSDWPLKLFWCCIGYYLEPLVL